MTMPEQINPAVWFPVIRADTGADVFTRRLANELNRRGLRSEICWLPHRSEYAPWSVATGKVPGWANIVHMNTWLHRKFSPEPLPVVATMHLCVHDPALEPYKGRLQSAYHRLWIKPVESRLLERADSIIGVSEYTTRQTQTCFGIQAVNTIHNGVDTKQFRPVDRSSPNRPFRLLYVGNWIARKGVDLLPSIMERLGNSHELLFTGDRGADRANLPANMKPIGRINSAEEMIRTYQQADALLFPTRLEGLPLSALEAQACGLPVIATNGSSLPEAVDDGITGILCEQDNVDAFTDAARKLANDTESWHGMRIAARQSMEDRFTLDAMIDKYISVYRNVLNNRKHGTGQLA